MPQFAFGLGQLIVVPGTNTPLVRATPVMVGTLQDVSVNIDYDLKELWGNSQFPVDVARGKAKITGKAKSGQLGSGLIASVLSGSTTGAGRKKGIYQEARTPAANTTTAVNGATYFEDLGVINTVTGLAMTRMPDATLQASLTAGQYTVAPATGVYNFATADANPPVLISYSYTVAGSGITTTLTNQLLGTSTNYVLELFNSFKSRDYGMRLNAITIPKLDFGFAQDNYGMADIDFSAFADSTGTVATIFTED